MRSSVDATRMQAVCKFNDARICAEKDTERLKKIAALKEVFMLLDKITSKQDDDIRLLISTHQSTATEYFNLHDFNNAAHHYNCAMINYPVILKKTDTDRRAYIFNSIDCCDAFLEMHNSLLQSPETSSNKSMQLEALRKKAHEFFCAGLDVFNCIVSKTPGEEALGNVSLNQKVYYFHYEQFTSYPSYLDSLKFKGFNQEQILFTNHDITEELYQRFNLLMLGNTMRVQPQPVLNQTQTPFNLYQPVKATENVTSVNDCNDMDVDMANSYGYKD